MMALIVIVDGLEERFCSIVVNGYMSSHPGTYKMYILIIMNGSGME